MPRVRIDIRKGRSEQEKHDLMEAVHLGIEDYDTMIILHETPMENWGVNGQPASPIEFKIDV